MMPDFSIPIDFSRLDDVSILLIWLILLCLTGALGAWLAEEWMGREEDPDE